MYSTENFDMQFLNLPLKLTPPEWDILENLKGDEFNYFDYFNTNYELDVSRAEHVAKAEHATLSIQIK